MNSETRIFVRDLISYTAVILLALLVFSTIWYLRAKFRKLLINGNRVMTEDIFQQRQRDQYQLRSDSNLSLFATSGSMPRARRATVQGDQIYYTPFDSGNINLFPFNTNDPPPSYSSLAFPHVFSTVPHKERLMNRSMERPPSYRSIFLVQPNVV